MRRTVALLSAATAFGLTASLPALAQEEQSIEVNGTTLHYVQQGEGEPVVFVHGAISTLQTWGQQVPALAEAGFQPIAYTLRYFGTEPWQDEGELFSAATHADDLAAFIEALGVGPVHLVAWSAGGEIATLAALEHPELVRSMALFEPALNVAQTTEEGKAEAAEVGAELGAAFGPAIEVINAGDLDRGVGMFIDIVWETPGAWDSLPPEAQQPSLDSGRTLMLYFAAPPTAMSCEALGALDTPTLLMVGEDTKLRYFPFVVEELARCLPNAETVSLPDTTHDGPAMSADAFNAEVIRFLTANSAQE